MRGLAYAALLVSFALTTGCTKASESSDAKRMPKPPPPIDGAQELHVPVEVDGVAQAPIDATKLSTTPPDFKDDEHRAWRVGTLLGPRTARAGTTITVSGPQNVGVTMKNSSSPTEPIPVFSVNRRGELIAEVVAPDKPFPAYHGQGGRLSRPGDPMPRIVGVTKIVVTTSDAGP